MSHHPRCGNGTNWTCPCTCDAEYAADTSEGRATPASAQKEPVDWALAFERLTQYAEHRVGCSANDLDPLDKTPCTCGLRAIYSPKGLPALSAHQATDEGEVERVAAIIRNWRAGNAGEDDAEDTARLILSTPTSQPPAAETRLREALEAIKKAETDVFDEDADEWVTAPMDIDEASQIANVALLGCTCMEVFGEDPNCIAHGRTTNPEPGCHIGSCQRHNKCMYQPCRKMGNEA